MCTACSACLLRCFFIKCSVSLGGYQSQMVWTRACKGRKQARLGIAGHVTSACSLLAQVVDGGVTIWVGRFLLSCEGLAEAKAQLRKCVALLEWAARAVHLGQVILTCFVHTMYCHYFEAQNTPMMYSQDLTVTATGKIFLPAAEAFPPHVERQGHILMMTVAV